MVYLFQGEIVAVLRSDQPRIFGFHPLNPVGDVDAGRVAACHDGGPGRGNRTGLGV